jgi:hypothetical protein
MSVSITSLLTADRLLPPAYSTQFLARSPEG